MAIANAQFTGDPRRLLAVAPMRWRQVVAGYPLVAVTGGTATSLLLASGDWRDVFFLGAGMALTLLPLVPLLMPEPVGALFQSGIALPGVAEIMPLGSLGAALTLLACPGERPREADTQARFGFTRSAC